MTRQTFYSIAAIVLAFLAGSAAIATPSLPAPGTIYAPNFTRTLEHFNPVGSAFDMPEFPQRETSGVIFYPNFADSQRHELPILAQTSIENLYNAPVPPGKTPNYFLVMTLSKRSSLSSVTFAPHNGEEASLVGGQGFPLGANYQLYEYAQGQQIGPPIPLAFHGKGQFWTFTAPFAHQTFLRNVPVIYEFVH
jgi:hypothetical protein